MLGSIKVINDINSRNNIEEKIQVNIDKMFKRSISAPLPKPSEAKNHLYA